MTGGRLRDAGSRGDGPVYGFVCVVQLVQAAKRVTTRRGEVTSFAKLLVADETSGFFEVQAWGEARVASVLGLRPGEVVAFDCLAVTRYQSRTGYTPRYASRMYGPGRLPRELGGRAAELEPVAARVRLVASLVGRAAADPAAHGGDVPLSALIAGGGASVCVSGFVRHAFALAGAAGVVAVVADGGGLEAEVVLPLGGGRESVLSLVGRRARFTALLPELEGADGDFVLRGGEGSHVFGVAESAADMAAFAPDGGAGAAAPVVVVGWGEAVPLPAASGVRQLELRGAVVVSAVFPAPLVRVACTACGDGPLEPDASGVYGGCARCGRCVPAWVYAASEVRVVTREGGDPMRVHAGGRALGALLGGVDAARLGQGGGGGGTLARDIVDSFTAALGRGAPLGEGVSLLVSEDADVDGGGALRSALYTLDGVRCRPTC